LANTLAERFDQVDAFFGGGFKEWNIETIGQSLSFINRNFSVLRQVAFVALQGSVRTCENRFFDNKIDLLFKAEIKHLNVIFWILLWPDVSKLL
jgi:hypothetical protein